MSFCLTSESCQQKKTLASSRKHKNKNITFLVQALINHIMVSELPPNCPSTLPDGHVLTATLVGMDKDRFSSMFLDGIQVR